MVNVHDVDRHLKQLKHLHYSENFDYFSSHYSRRLYYESKHAWLRKYHPEYRSTSHDFQFGIGFLEQIKTSNFKSILDVGCGSGKFCRVVKDDGICDIVHGVDIVDSVIAPIEGIMFDFGYHAHMLPYGDNQFDVVTSFNVLEFNIAEDIPVILDELFRVASKQVFLSVSKAESKGYRNEVGELHATIRNAGWWGKQLAKFRGERYYFIEWTSTDLFWAIDVR